jgi:hypothetical protein
LWERNPRMEAALFFTLWPLRTKLFFLEARIGIR